ncbi:hypothetical protein GCM10010277_08280 [Streptomyces longisporoflavus]|uniref:DUF2795 domain-containing protein n=1 Tax=Streptomyces longisporoflavus TaxID=28044 RepID=UPI00167D90BE|nr:DUF2795 domain-containing protein [Streptomyces longisporoflavus]GGV26986.1 hypothetical protein GCM10010277_08280 [Streptomyces longisporoflavus]
MDRGSNQVSPREDDERKHELEGYLRSGQHTHVEEANDPEPPADDDIVPDAGGPVPPPGEDRERARSAAEADALRLELSRHLEHSTFPADRQSLLSTLEAHQAPEQALEAVRKLPDGKTYGDVTRAVRALGGAPSG